MPELRLKQYGNYLLILDTSEQQISDLETEPQYRVVSQK